MRRVLVLRPEPGASATVEKARGLGLGAQSVPLFQIELVEWEAPEASGFDGLLVTSANAMRAGGKELERLRGLKVYAVGVATAEAAREAGFDVAAVGDAGVDRLLGSIEGDLRLLHLCGEDRREPTEARQDIKPIAVYRSKPTPAPDLSQIPGSVVLVHSPRAAQRLGELISERDSIALVAISRAAAQAAGQGWERIEVANDPSDDALLALAARLCNKPDPK